MLRTIVTVTLALLLTALAPPLASAATDAAACETDTERFDGCAAITCPPRSIGMGYSVREDCRVVYTEPVKLCVNGYYHTHEDELVVREHYHC